MAVHKQKDRNTQTSSYYMHTDTGIYCKSFPYMWTCNIHFVFNDTNNSNFHLEFKTTWGVITAVGLRVAKTQRVRKPDVGKRSLHELSMHMPKSFLFMFGMWIFAGPMLIEFFI